VLSCTSVQQQVVGSNSTACPWQLKAECSRSTAVGAEDALDHQKIVGTCPTF
jgi:hypothetical protein